MRSVFVSYAQADVEAVKPLQSALRDSGVSVWRDRENLRAGQRWPKVLGDAIAETDAVLLVWSENAADSTYVEQEWCAAIALKKDVLPYRLDDTPLPPSLRAVHTVDAQQGGDAISLALRSLSQKAPKAPAKVKNPMLKWWALGAILVIGVVGVIGFALNRTDSPVSGNTPQSQAVMTQTLAGSIRDADGDPLAGVRVSLPALDVSATTDALGRFEMEVTAPHQTEVEVLAVKAGYQTHERYATLGNVRLSFTMRRKEP